MAKWRDVKQNRIKQEKNSIMNESQNSDSASLPSRLKLF